MARYRKVDPRIWDDEKFVEWDDLKRTLWLLLLTGPAVDAVPGLQVGGAASLAETLRRPDQTVRERLGELLGEGLVELDERRRLIRLPNALRYNEPDNPNQVIGWWKAWEGLPESPLKYAHIPAIREACEAADRRKNDGKITFTQRFDETFGTVEVTVTPTVTPTVGVSRARSEQEQEQEQEHKERSLVTRPKSTQPTLLPADPPAPTKPKASKPGDAETVFTYWSEKLMPSAKASDKRLTRIKARLKEGFTVEQLRLAVDGALQDPFLMGTDPKSRKGGYRDVETVLRDAAQVERLIELSKSADEDFEWTEPPEIPNEDPPGTVYCGPTPEFLEALDELQRKQGLS